MTNTISRPPHYTFSRIEPIEVIEAWSLNFHRGAVVKYIARAGRKESELRDLRKARWFLSREIRRLSEAEGAARAKTVLLGQAPSATSDPGRPLRGRPLSRIAAVMDMSQDEVGDTFELRNLLNVYPGAAADGRGHAWPEREGRAAAEVLARSLQGRRVVLLGANVARAFGLRPREVRMRWVRARGMDLAGLPHPSGLSRWWNDPEHRAAAGEFLRAEVRS